MTDALCSRAEVRFLAWRYPEEFGTPAKQRRLERILEKERQAQNPTRIELVPFPAAPQS